MQIFSENEKSEQSAILLSRANKCRATDYKIVGSKIVAKAGELLLQVMRIKLASMSGMLDPCKDFGVRLVVISKSFRSA